MRAPYQVLVIPYFKQDNEILYCLFEREDMKVWQGIAGGGEEGEEPIVAAKREAFEEAGLPLETSMIQLDSIASIPVIYISGFIWGKDTLVIPEYSFGVELPTKEISLSHEHLAHEWVTYEVALERLKWDSNRTALWELNYRVANNLIKTA
jgi:dihydroneopterin triphosphate diphosphatase